MMNSTQDTHDNPTRAIRRDFFAYRNGIVADKLRSAGDPHTIIMGCLLADLMAITDNARNGIGSDDRLAAAAQELWNDTNSRECRLAAPMLFPPELMSAELALDWCQNIETTEVADNLCHKLLKHITGSQQVMNQLISRDEVMAKYTGYRLMQGLLVTGKLQATPALQATVSAEAAQAQGNLAKLLSDVQQTMMDD